MKHHSHVIENRNGSQGKKNEGLSEATMESAPAMKLEISQ